MGFLQILRSIFCYYLYWGNKFYLWRQGENSKIWFTLLGVQIFQSNPGYHLLPENGWIWPWLFPAVLLLIPTLNHLTQIVKSDLLGDHCLGIFLPEKEFLVYIKKGHKISNPSWGLFSFHWKTLFFLSQIGSYYSFCFALFYFV